MTPTIKLTSTRKIWNLLTPVEQRGALVLLGLMFVGMTLETLGVGLVIPAIALIMQGDFERNYPLFQPALNWLGNPSQQALAVGGMLMLVGVYLIKALYLAFLSWWQALKGEDITVYGDARNPVHFAMWMKWSKPLFG